MTDAKEIIVAAIMGLVLSLVGLAGIACAEVIAFHAPLKPDGSSPCAPCIEMQPVEREVIREGYDIRQTNDGELAAKWSVPAYPCYVNVWRTPDGKPLVAGYIVGKCTAGQLRRLCVMPVAASVGSASRNAIRALVTPTPCWGY